MGGTSTIDVSCCRECPFCVDGEEETEEHDGLGPMCRSPDRLAPSMPTGAEPYFEVGDIDSSPGWCFLKDCDHLVRFRRRSEK
jgi:hypothetical protein